jgi:hypothetical protein
MSDVSISLTLVFHDAAFSGGRRNVAVNKQIGWTAGEAETPKTKGKKMCAETIFAGELIKNGIYY